MREPIELQLDVTEAAAVGERVHTAVTVFLPERDRTASPRVVVFGFPGAGYSRRYFSFDMPGTSFGGQAGYHADRHGWIFVACDHLGVGDSSLPDPARLTLANVAAANAATVDHVVDLLTRGSVDPDVPPISDVARIGIGQSMGGCLTIWLQGTTPRFDAIAILGYSAIQSVIPRPDGSALSFGDDPESHPPAGGRDNALRWAFHYPDVPADVVAADITDYPARGGNLPSWASATLPGCVVLMPKLGVVAEQAAAIDVPVFVGMGEIDIIPDARAEPAAYPLARDITVYIQARMAHMHNFAGNRTQLWDRLAGWVEATVQQREARPRRH